MSSEDPEQEAARLEALRQYRILDTAPEQCFDDIARLAAYICGTPIAAVSLLDDCRQWFKSRIGLKVSQTPRAVAFCRFTIKGTDVMVVEDAAADGRFADNPLVTDEPRIRFYAGAPLLTASGHALGTVCVIDREPRRLEPGPRDALASLARTAVGLFELRRVSSHLADAAEHIKALTGMLSVCAWCKQLRDEAGEWMHAEEFLTRRADLKLTHGICPECLQEQTAVLNRC